MSGFSPSSPISFPMYGPRGSSFVAAQTSSVITLLLPASNPWGIWLRTATLWVASGFAALYSDTAAPTGATDTSKRMIFGGVGPGSLNLPFPIETNPGEGIYFAVASGTQFAAITFDSR